MKRYCLNNFFRIYSCKFFPIKYITQNKEKETLKDSCFKEMFMQIKAKNYFIDVKGILFALTNETVVNVLRKNKKIYLFAIKIPFSKMNVNGLKKYLVGDNTRCNRCSNNDICKFKRFAEKESQIKNSYFLFIKA